jgi:hypothetical protein
MRLNSAVLLSLLISASAWAADIKELSWLEGNWRSSSGSGSLQMQFSSTEGQIILGTSKLVDSNGATTFFEFLQIKQDGSILILSPQPYGKQGVLFQSTLVTNQRVVFENSLNEFPKKITYDKISPAQIKLIAEGYQNKTPVKLEYILDKEVAP